MPSLSSHLLLLLLLTAAPSFFHNLVSFTLFLILSLPLACVPRGFSFALFFSHVRACTLALSALSPGDKASHARMLREDWRVQIAQQAWIYEVIGCVLAGVAC